MNNPIPVAVSSVSAAIPSGTPFHPGEQYVQTLAGVREEAEARGQKMLTPQLVDAQRLFFARLSFVVAAHVDANGQPRATLLTGEPGFIQATPDGRVRVERGGATGPTVLDTTPGAQLGLLGIEFARRRRNRINGTVEQVATDYVSLSIDQGYGNCPKYITKRPWGAELFRGDYIEQCWSEIPAATDEPAVNELIAQADTFFIASSSGVAGAEEAVQSTAWGADISHRGGDPGFLRRAGNVLAFDDFSGNNMFNTLGNLKQYPPCGLLILDFETGALLQLTGAAQLQHDGTRYSVAVTIDEVRYWSK